MKIFISGSIRSKPIPEDWLETIVTDEHQVFLIGDAPGVDTMVQKHLYTNGKSNVTIYHSTTKPRNNIGGWNCKKVTVEDIKSLGVNEKIENFFTAKDIMMSVEADYGIVFWNGVSRGSSKNILRLVNSGKPVKIYTMSESEWVPKIITNMTELVQWSHENTLGDYLNT